MDAVIIAVAHKEFKELSGNDINKYFREKALNENRVIIDVKGILNKDTYQDLGYNYFRL